MQSINIYLKIFLLILVQVFYGVSINAPVSTMDTISSSSFSLEGKSYIYNYSPDKMPSPNEEHKHHLTDIETLDEEPTQQHQNQVNLICLLNTFIRDSSIGTDTILYPKPYFDISAPPPEFG